MLSSQTWGWSEGVQPKHAEELNLNLGDRRLRLTLDLARQLMGAPRHLSQHPGGFVLTHDRLDELVPIEPAAMKDRQVIEWDKDDIDALKFMKVDCLALGMMSCMKRGLDLLKAHKDIDLDLATIPAEDPRTYAMIRRADTLGVFQIESRAQMAMLPRIKPRTFYDLVIEVAIVRPGPIQGDMVHPYLRRREGKEPVVFPKPELEKVLGKTLGVPLFPGAGHAGGHRMRRLHRRRGRSAAPRHGHLQVHRRGQRVQGQAGRRHGRARLRPGVRREDLQPAGGLRLLRLSESHAASFALIAYASSWLKCHHPDVFCAALLNAQPMGFYAPAQIVRDAQEHGVEVRPVCVNASRWDCTLEPTDQPDRFAMRLGPAPGARPRQHRRRRHRHSRADDRPFASVDDALAPRRRAGRQPGQDRRGRRLPPVALGLARREALWAIKALRDEPLPLFAAASAREQAIVPEVDEPEVALKPMKAGREVVEDYGHTGLTLREHPVTFLRQDLAREKFMTCAAASAGQGFPELQGRGPGPGPPEARLSEERHLHHPGRRDRRRQPRGLGAGLRKTPPHRAHQLDAGRGRSDSARRRCGPRGRLQAHRPLGGAGQHRRPRRPLPSAPRAGRRIPSRSIRARSSGAFFGPEDAQFPLSLNG